MEHNISNLKTIIEREAAALEILSDLMIKQKAAVIKGDLKLLDEITAEQSRVYTQIADLEQIRLEIVEPLADELEIEPEEVSLEIIRKHVGLDKTSQLDSIYKLLKPMVDKVRRAADLNKRIMEKCLQNGEQRLKMMLNFHSKQGTYSPAGKKTEASGNSSVVYNKKV